MFCGKGLNWKNGRVRGWRVAGNCARFPSSGSASAIGIAGLLEMEMAAMVCQALAQQPCPRGSRLSDPRRVLLAAEAAGRWGVRPGRGAGFLDHLVLQLRVQCCELLCERFGLIAH